MAKSGDTFGIEYVKTPMEDYRKRDETLGIEYFDIPPGLSLYRGYNPKRSVDEIPSIDYNFLWFGFNPDELRMYGVVHQYETKSGFKLLALDKSETLHWIYESTDDANIRRFLKHNFGYKSATEIGKRQSDTEPDKVIVRYLQNTLLKETEYNGYGISDMKGEQSHFHPEICVFFPDDHIQHVRVLPGQQFEKKAPPVERKKRNMQSSPEPELPSSSAMAPQTPNSPPPLDKLNFGYDSPEQTNAYNTPVGTPTGTPTKRLRFGGKKHKKTTKRRRRTNRKTKRH